MTWRELKQAIEEMEPRFLDTEVQVYNVEDRVTYMFADIYNDCNDDDYVIDKDQPQLWTNFDEFD
jgi:hypothetical protein